MAKKIKSLEDLTPDVANANKGNPRGVYMVETSLEKLGAGRSIVVDRDGNVIAGNKTLQVAIEKGFDIEVVPTDGKKLVVVQRQDLDLNDPDGQARQLAYADNRAGEVGLEWDIDRLVSDLAIGIELDDWFLDWEVDKLVGNASEEFDPSAHWTGMPEFEQDDIKAFHSIKVHFETEQDLEAFAALLDQTVTDKTKYIYYPKQEKEDLKQYAVIDES